VENAVKYEPYDSGNVLNIFVQEECGIYGTLENISNIYELYNDIKLKNTSFSKYNFLWNNTVYFKVMFSPSAIYRAYGLNVSKEQILSAISIDEKSGYFESPSTYEMVIGGHK
jgi:hypothetical protein